jgi:hypothetical protein
MEKLIPERLKQRRQEALEDQLQEQNETRSFIGGFSIWQEVAAAVDIMFDAGVGKVGVRKGTPGIVVDVSPDNRHVL